MTKLRCYLAEFLGALLLTFMDAGIGVMQRLHPHDVTMIMRAFAPGLTVLALIFALGELSGAHFNPAVTLAFSLRGVFPWSKALKYWCVQFLGATVGALFLKTMFNLSSNVGMTTPDGGVWVSFATESILTFFLVIVILCTSYQHKIKGVEAAFPVAATIVVCGLFGKVITHASMNPARSLGAAFASCEFAYQWIYLFAPALGAVTAVGGAWLFFGPPRKKDWEMAQGEKNFR